MEMEIAFIHVSSLFAIAALDGILSPVTPQSTAVKMSLSSSVLSIISFPDLALFSSWALPFA